MSVSVIVPLYNKQDTIARALDSIRRQSFSDFEVIVVDDGSTDNSPEIVKQQLDLPLVFLRQPNQGPGAARNAGARVASGDYLAFLDADDEWLPEYLEQSISRLDRAVDCAATVSGYIEFPNEISREAMWRARGVREGRVQLTKYYRLGEALAYLSYMCPWSTMIRAKSFWRWGGFYARERCRYAEDSHLWLKVLCNERVLFSFEPLVRFHRESSALSANLSGARPIEPFLKYPAEILQDTPDASREFVSKVLAARAAKTACVLGYWGKWREAAELLKRFFTPGWPLLPYGFPALVCATPIAPLLGRCARGIAGRLSST